MFVSICLHKIWGQFMHIFLAQLIFKYVLKIGLYLIIKFTSFDKTPPVCEWHIKVFEKLSYANTIDRIYWQLYLRAKHKRPKSSCYFYWSVSAKCLHFWSQFFWIFLRQSYKWFKVIWNVHIFSLILNLLRKNLNIVVWIISNVPPPRQ